MDSTGSLGMAGRLLSSMVSMVTLLRGGLLLGLLLAISGAASPWGGEEESRLASHQSSLANNGVRSVMKRGTGGVKRKSEKKSGGGTERQKKTKKGEKGKKEKNVKKGKNRKGKKSKGERGKGKL